MINSCSLSGRIGGFRSGSELVDAPKLLEFESGAKLLKFTFAIDTIGDKETPWIDLQAWGKLAEILTKYAVKGQQLFVQCHLQSSSWKTEDGSKRSRIEYIIDNFTFGTKPNPHPEMSEAETEIEVEVVAPEVEVIAKSTTRKQKAATANGKTGIPAIDDIRFG